jgi:hypothetical protein
MGHPASWSAACLMRWSSRAKARGCLFNQENKKHMDHLTVSPERSAILCGCRPADPAQRVLAV